MSTIEALTPYINEKLSIRNLNQKVNEDSADWDALGDLLEECQVETVILALSYQHDHYLKNTPKMK